MLGAQRSAHFSFTNLLVRQAILYQRPYIGVCKNNIYNLKGARISIQARLIRGAADILNVGNLNLRDRILSTEAIQGLLLNSFFIATDTMKYHEYTSLARDKDIIMAPISLVVGICL